MALLFFWFVLVKRTASEEPIKAKELAWVSPQVLRLKRSSLFFAELLPPPQRRPGYLVMQPTSAGVWSMYIMAHTGKSSLGCVMTSLPDYKGRSSSTMVTLVRKTFQYPGVGLIGDTHHGKLCADSNTSKLFWEALKLMCTVERQK